MTKSRLPVEDMPAEVKDDRSVAHPAPLDRRQAQQMLLTLGSLGRVLTDAINSRVDPDLAGNVAVLVVTYLDTEGPMRPVDIASRTGMTSGGVTKLLDRLEMGGYITREVGALPSDKRAIVVALTPDGRRVARVYAEAVLGATDDVQEAIARLCGTMDRSPRT